MKILLLGDASNCHRALSAGLKSLGHDVTVVSNGTGWMKTERDIDISRRLPGKLGGAELYFRALMWLAPKLRGYDVVALHNPMFLELKPQRCSAVFDRLKRGNGAVFLTALAADSLYVEECLDPASAMHYNEFRIGNEPSPHAVAHPDILKGWLSAPMTEYCNHFYDRIDGAVGVLWEYMLPLSRRLAPEQIAYGGIPIDTRSIEVRPIAERPERVRLFLGRHRDRQIVKGTDRMEVAARRALERHPGKGELVIVENRPYREYVELLSSSQVVLDQAYSYTPATNALLAMASGQCTVSGGEPEYYDYIGERENHPIWNCPVDVEGMTRLFEEILTSPPGALRERGLRGREFVERHNDVEVVAHRFLSAWERGLERRKLNSSRG